MCFNTCGTMIQTNKQTKKQSKQQIYPGDKRDTV